MTPPASGWRLIWHDEFNGTSIDTSKWEVMGRRSWGCWERRLGWWSEEDAYLDGRGNLVLRTREVPLAEFREKCPQDERNPWGAKYWDNEYFSGAIRSRGKFERAFGYFEARVAFAYDATRPGHWPAFWLYNDSVKLVDNSGRDGTEIDIFEYWETDFVTHALHWDGYDDQHHKKAVREVRMPGLSAGYHVFGLLWTPDVYVFYIDGKETWRTAQGGVAQTPLYIKLTDEIEAYYGLVSEADLPHHTLVDYVRVYETPPVY
ncbi:MAG: glycoside hydrolase family 16 protein [Chloroflexaceae bacterium]|nr:glycoside hydrolase family 16 protein [Chloroflexaceae bacterium]